MINDIALVKLTNQIKPQLVEVNKASMYTINSICLPKKFIVNKKLEIALFSGWGSFKQEGGEISDELRKAKYNMSEHNVSNCDRKHICNQEDRHMTCFVSNRLLIIKEIFTLNIRIKFELFIGRHWFTISSIR